uniref:Integrase, catalytic region, zinc finger, CCHC-type, peptidase aspartic, catalytic n=1 Tax=Tanacetum cinerariifolium TaxID=118510 RepID=A0A6L2NM31_TANCI|nr:hypothetical protein [Tanacetum cinerariifolium]
MEMKDTLSSCSNSEAQQMQQIQDKAKKSCMVSFRQLHSHLKRLSQNNLQGSQTESGFKCAFATLSCQDTETFTSTMFLNVEQLEKQLDKEDFQEIRSMAAFNVLETQFQMFITNRDYLNDEYIAMTRSYFIQYTGQAILEFRDTLIQHLESVKKSIDERVHLKREYDRQQQTEQPEFNNEGEVVQNAEECHDTCPLLAIFTDNQIPEHSYQSLEFENSCLKKTVARFQKDFSRLEAHCVNLEQHTRNSMNDSCVTKFLKEVNSRAKVPSNKTPKRNKPVEQIGVPNKQERKILTGHRFSIRKTFVVQKKIMTPRSCLRWKPMGKIFKTVGLRWVLTGRILTSSTTKVDSEPPNGSNADITNQNEYEQTLDVRAELGLHDHSNEPSSSKLVPNVVPPADKAATSRQELEFLFHPHITMLSHKVFRLGFSLMIQPEPEGSTQGHSIVKIAVLMYDGDECEKGRMPTKIELTLEQSQQGVSNDILVTEHFMAQSDTDLKMAKLTTSSPNHLTSNIEDAFSSNFLDFIPASPDYVRTSPGKNYSSSSNSFVVVPIASPFLLLFHNDPYMKVLQAFYAKESPIPPPNPITPPVILTPSPVLPPSPLFDP